MLLPSFPWVRNSGGSDCSLRQAVAQGVSHWKASPGMENALRAHTGCWQEASVTGHMGLVLRQLQCPHDLASGFRRATDPKESKAEAAVSLMTYLGCHTQLFSRYPVSCPSQSPPRLREHSTRVGGGCLPRLGLVFLGLLQEK